eukprot:8156597-Pyramimonas_sp.AAC.1
MQKSQRMFATQGIHVQTRHKTYKCATMNQPVHSQREERPHTSATQDMNLQMLQQPPPPEGGCAP